MSGRYAVAICHVPEGLGLVPHLEGTWATPFKGVDPLRAAKVFAEAERERGEFGPGALWTVVANEAAEEAHVDGLFGGGA